MSKFLLWWWARDHKQPQRLHMGVHPPHPPPNHFPVAILVKPYESLFDRYRDVTMHLKILNASKWKTPTIDTSPTTYTWMPSLTASSSHQVHIALQTGYIQSLAAGNILHAISCKHSATWKDWELNLKLFCQNTSTLNMTHFYSINVTYTCPELSKYRIQFEICKESISHGAMSWSGSFYRDLTWLFKVALTENHLNNMTSSTTTTKV